MKTEIPLKGMQVATNHKVVHLAMAIAQPLCMALFRNQGCQDDDRSVLFIVVHLYCFFSELFSDFCIRNSYNLIGDIASFSRMPIYFWAIYDAHYMELKNKVEGTGDHCSEYHVDLIQLWYIIELRVFYAFIAAAILFLMGSKLLGISTERKNKHAVVDDADRDFIETNMKHLLEFCLYSFQLITTIILWVLHAQEKKFQFYSA